MSDEVADETGADVLIEDEAIKKPPVTRLPAPPLEPDPEAPDALGEAGGGGSVASDRTAGRRGRVVPARRRPVADWDGWWAQESLVAGNSLRQRTPARCCAPPEQRRHRPSSGGSAARACSAPACPAKRSPRRHGRHRDEARHRGKAMNREFENSGTSGPASRQAQSPAKSPVLYTRPDFVLFHSVETLTQKLGVTRGPDSPGRGQGARPTMRSMPAAR